MEIVFKSIWIIIQTRVSISTIFHLNIECLWMILANLFAIAFIRFNFRFIQKNSNYGILRFYMKLSSCVGHHNENTHRCVKYKSRLTFTLNVCLCISMCEHTTFSSIGYQWELSLKQTKKKERRGTYSQLLKKHFFFGDLLPFRWIKHIYRVFVCVLWLNKALTNCLFATNLLEKWTCQLFHAFFKIVTKHSWWKCYMLFTRNPALWIIN